MPDERRNEPRIPVNLDVIWEATAGLQGARTSDLSLGGCFVDSFGRVAEGERIKFKMILPHGEWVEIEGVVAYQYPMVGFGVRFINMSDEVREKLGAVLHG